MTKNLEFSKAKFLGLERERIQWLRAFAVLRTLVGVPVPMLGSFHLPVSPVPEYLMYLACVGLPTLTCTYQHTDTHAHT